MGSIIAARATPPTWVWVAPWRHNASRSSISVRSHSNDDGRTQANSYKKSLATAPVIAVTSEKLSGYARSVWGNYFIDYEPQTLQVRTLTLQRWTYLLGLFFFLDYYGTYIVLLLAV